jgi:hypothetical protein
MSSKNKASNKGGSSPSPESQTTASEYKSVESAQGISLAPKGSPESNPFPAPGALPMVSKPTAVKPTDSPSTNAPSSPPASKVDKPSS